MLNPTYEQVLRLMQCGFNPGPIDAFSGLPLIEWKQYQTKPTTTRDWQEWLYQWPDAQICVFVTQTQVCLDLDGHDRDDFKAAKRTITKLLSLPPLWWPTPQARTPHGYHIWFESDDFMNANLRRHGVSIDVKAHRGLVKVPPAPGRVWVKPPWRERLMRIPERLRQWLLPMAARDKAPQAAFSIAPAIGGAERPELIQRARNYIRKMPPAISGEHGHDATFAVACALVHGFALDKQTAWMLLVDYNHHACFPPWSSAELQHKLESAASAVGRRPRGYLLHSRRMQPAQLFRLGR